MSNLGGDNNALTVSLFSSVNDLPDVVLASAPLPHIGVSGAGFLVRRRKNARQAA